MKESVLWRRLDRAVGTRLRARYKNRESGVAMVMALMFILVVLLTSTLLLGILLSQALPYRNNARNAQGKVAAEAGLQAGLSFLRTAESYYETGNYSKLMPATAADPSKPSLDETYAMETATTSGSTTGTVNVVALNYVPVDDTSSGTTAVSTSSATHNQKLSYRIQIGYYDGDPDAGGKMVTDATKLSSVKYAVVVSYGYVNRYPDGRTSGTEADPVRTAAAKYKFGQSQENGGGGGGGGGSPMRNMPMEDDSAPWILVESTTTDSNGDLDTLTAIDSIDASHGNTNWWKGYEKLVPDPRNSLCFVATTDSEGNIDPTKSAVVNSAVRLFRKAVQTGDKTLQYSDYCKQHGKYSHLNQWVYGKDDSIRLKGTNLCMTGLDTSYRTTGGKGGKAQDGAIRLTTCGNSYSPAISDGKVDAGTEATWKAGGQGYDTEAELNDPNSLLNKYQKWGFYLGFVNAGYVNFGKLNTADADTLYYSRGDMHSNSSEYVHTLFQTMYAQRIANANSSASAKWGQCDADVSSKQYGSDATGGDSCFLISTQWTDKFSDNGFTDASKNHAGASDIRTFAESLGAGGEAGWNTNQIVSDSGACLFASNNGGTVAVTKQCFVNAAPGYSYCYSTLLYGQDMKTGASWQYPCPVTSNDNVQSKFDNIIYDRGTDGINGKKLTTLRMTWGQSGDRNYGVATATISYRCFYTDGNTAGSWLKNRDRDCPTASIGNNSTFYRFEYVGPNSVYNYKFVLASSYDGKDDNTTNSLCLTEMTNGLTGADYASNANSYFYQIQKYAPKVVLQKCTKQTTNVLGEVSYPQQWNGVRPDGGGAGGGGATYKKSIESSISYASSKYVDAANWKW